MAEQSKFACASCGKQYPWKAELAGRKAKCGKCGQVITVPAAPADDDASAYDLAPDEPKRGATRSAAQPARAAASPGSSKASVCPSCSAPVAPGAVLCVQCGFNLKTGQRIGTQVAPAADDAIDLPMTRPSAASPPPKSAAPLYPGVAPMRTPTMAEPDKKAQMMKIVVPIGALVLLIGLFIVGKAIFKKSGDTGPVSKAGDDALVAEMRKEQYTLEARQWLSDKQRNPQGFTNPQGLAWVDKLYGAGAKQVICFGATYTNAFGVELPDDKDKRAELFKMLNNWHAKEIEIGAVKEAKEEGQRWALMHLRMVQ